MAHLEPTSGFSEFLPVGRLVENRVFVAITPTFELHGFVSIETRAVESLDQLARKGGIDKEIYTVRCLYAQEGDADELGLHFDLTVPFARYVLERSGRLNFPFRCYQVQKVWRGERPQEGCCREFIQADIDIIGRDRLADHHDAEIPLVALDVFGRLHRDLGLPPVSIRVNNWKLSEGFYRGLGIESTVAVLQRVNKYDKVEPDVVVELLAEQAGLSETQARVCVALAGISSEDGSFINKVRAPGVTHELLEGGLADLAPPTQVTHGAESGRVVVDLRIARRLDYYTGTVYETLLLGSERLDSVASGGHYDSLASDGRTIPPGVGYSFGVTRVLASLIGRGVLTVTRGVPSVALMAVDSEETRDQAISVARRSRERGVVCEVAPKADKFGRQIRFAECRGIPFIWLSANLDDSVKNIRSGEQLPADPDVWLLPTEDAIPRVTRGRRPGKGTRRGEPSRAGFAVGGLYRLCSRNQRGNCMLCTYHTGEPKVANVGQEVVLAGWVAKRRDHGGVAFIDLRDVSGVVQMVVRDEVLAPSGTHDLRNEFCIKVIGVVKIHPEDNANPDLPAGKIEAAISELEVLNPSVSLPLQIDERVTVGEGARLKHRHLDPRRPAPVAALRLRSKVNQVVRKVLRERDFVEIEAPTPTRSTPEGACDLLVPTRLNPGSWYALSQSPQLFKQFLMMARIERYHQIARCYRDEDSRADRQPEFAQLDIETSSVDQEDVIELGEAIVKETWAIKGTEP